MATTTDCHFSWAFAKSNESPNFIDVPSNLSFSRNPNRLLKKNENPTNSSRKMTIMPTVTLQRLRKLELTQQRVARIENFFNHCKIATSSRLDCPFRRKFRFFRGETKNLKLSGISVRIFNLTDLFSIRLRKSSSPCNSLLRLIYFRKPSSTRNGFSKPRIHQRSIHGPACPGPWSSLKALWAH